MKAKVYHFHTNWNIAAPKEIVWQTLASEPFSWQEWWPELDEVHDIQPVEGLTGTTFGSVWRAPLGYRLRSNLKVGKLVYLKKVTLHSSGDLNGTIICEISEKSGNTHIGINWRVTTTKPWMNYLAPLLKPLFVYNHHAVMRSGERGLRRFLHIKNPAAMPDFSRLP